MCFVGLYAGHPYIQLISFEIFLLSFMIYIAECPGGTVTESNPSARVPFINCTVVTGNLVVGINPVIGFK